MGNNDSGWSKKWKWIEQKMIPAYSDQKVTVNMAKVNIPNDHFECNGPKVIENRAESESD